MMSKKVLTCFYLPPFARPCRASFCRLLLCAPPRAAQLAAPTRYAADRFRRSCMRVRLQA
eukprot:6179428-Pleurochrysis_carterae.AAC.1